MDRGDWAMLIFPGAILLIFLCAAAYGLWGKWIDAWFEVRSKRQEACVKTWKREQIEKIERGSESSTLLRPADRHKEEIA